MSITKEKFISEFVQAIKDNQAAVFAGAGISQPLGIPSWKNVLEPLATEMQIKLSNETDLTQIAQYYVNENNGRRTELEAHFIKEINKSISIEENSLINILTKLDISSYWTTNYDMVFEHYFEYYQIKYNKIASPNAITTLYNATDKNLYKMHGDLSTKMIITKEDYELYEQENEPFLLALKSELMQKHFVFLGFSFNDSNLNKILSDMKKMFGNEHLKKHYCFFKIPDKDEEKIQLNLKIKDLERYGIETVLVESFSQLQIIFSNIMKKVWDKNIFISGSAFQYGIWETEKTKYFLERLGEKLIENGYKIYSAFGKNIGEYILKGAIKAFSQRENTVLKTQIEYLAFPNYQVMTLQEQDKFRKDIIKQCGWAIFLFGNREDAILAPGVLREYELSKMFDKKIIPVASTGFAAERIWNLSMIEKKYQYLQKYSDALRKNMEPETLLNTMLQIIESENTINM